MWFGDTLGTRRIRYIDGNCSALIELWNSKSKRKQKRWLNNNWIQFPFFLLLLLKILIAAAARAQLSHCHKINLEWKKKQQWTTNRMPRAKNDIRSDFFPSDGNGLLNRSRLSAHLASVQRKTLGTRECGNVSQPNHLYFIMWVFRYMRIDVVMKLFNS